MLQLHQLQQVKNFVSPFAADDEGFPGRWWDRWDRIGDNSTRALNFTMGGEEVARAEVDPAAHIVTSNYVGVGIREDIVDVTFFEVRESRHRQGIGRGAVALIVDHYPGRDLVAFSHDADHFWASIGWQRFTRMDKDEGFPSLFVHLAPQAGGATAASSTVGANRKRL